MLSGVINTNVNALYALNSLNNTTNATNRLEQELSSGLAINSPADNPAGYIAAQGFTAQLSGTNQAAANANQAISLVQTADGAITQQVNILQNILSIASQAANGGQTSQQLASLQQVVSQLQTEVSSIATQTNFNGVALINGTFQNINFQVGAQAGQTIGLTIGSTAANQIGAYQSGAAAGGIYVATGAGTGGVGDNTGNSFTISAAGAFTAGNVGVSGSSGNANVAVTQAESALNFAAGVNSVTSKTNVTATADTSVAFTVTAGTVSFTLGNGTGAAQTNPVNISGTISSVTAAGLANIVSQINQATGQTGIVAAVDANNHLVLTQSQGDNISIHGFAGTGTLAAGGTTLAGGGTTAATIQGLTTLQSTQSFGLSNTDAGLAVTSSLSALSAVNVSTQAGATAALNVVNFALQQLENVGGQLGAIQQELQATVSNLQSTATNITAAKGVVEDANIPQVTTELTQQQILQQAGVSALAQSSALQQSFLKLLQ
ncbi:MAG: flagellar protein FlaB [Alphaproteobacteria bacterium]|nr:flagellar protein FlaB [Alphaproteobacteria bacterium]MBV9551559.1 flagellar protein FlaB [Alphaproteobacteria bacterium]